MDSPSNYYICYIHVQRTIKDGALVISVIEEQVGTPPALLTAVVGPERGREGGREGGRVRMLEWRGQKVREGKAVRNW